MSVDALYPFLSNAPVSPDAVLAQVRNSTAEKAREIAELRRVVLDRYGEALIACATEMAGCFAGGGTLFTFGNGGSSTDAQDVATTFLAPVAGQPLPALSLTADIAVVTALSNDIGFEVVFARQLAAMGKPSDIALGLSTSGGSANVLAGFAEARRRGLLTVGMAGYDGGRMAESDDIDHLFVMPSSSVHRIQELQTTVYHVLWELTQRALTA